jgi:hypothetical protein
MVLSRLRCLFVGGSAGNEQLTLALAATHVGFDDR